MLNRVDECIIRLTKEEALSLLELAMACPLDLSADQRAAIVKLGEFCRECMRADIAESARDAHNVMSAAFAA